MKTSIKFATGLILAAAALVASGSAAQAGEGGAAGSVGVKFASTLSVITVAPGTPPVTINAPDVKSISSSVAVGKNTAAATARTGTDTFSSAVGNAGSVTLSNANDTTAGYLTALDATPTTAQANSLTPVATPPVVNLGPTGIVLP
jgi:hypothetical protein